MDVMTTTGNGEPQATRGGCKISDLQVLRGISILLVMLCHFSIPKTLHAGLFSSTNAGQINGH